MRKNTKEDEFPVVLTWMHIVYVIVLVIAVWEIWELCQ
jgi:hypothetical protein